MNISDWLQDVQRREEEIKERSRNSNCHALNKLTHSLNKRQKFFNLFLREKTNYPSLRDFLQDEADKMRDHLRYVHFQTSYWIGQKQITKKNRLVVNTGIEEMKVHFEKDEKMKEIWIMKRKWGNGTTQILCNDTIQFS